MEGDTVPRMAQALSLRKQRAAAQFGGVAYTPPSTYYLALLTNTGQYPDYTPTELTGTGYARVAVPNDSAHWTAPDENARVFNKMRVKWPEITTEDWPPVRGFAIYDAPTGGTALYFTGVYLNTPLIEGVQLILMENSFSYQEYS